MPKRMVFATNKGGCGKSTSTVICAEILAEIGYKVLVIDFDSQGNSTRILTQESIYKYSGDTIMEAIQAGDIRPYRLKLKENLHLVPAEDKLAVFSRYIYTARIENPFAVLKRLLAPIENEYDFIFIDVPPTLGDTVINAIVYADYILIPVDGGDLAADAMIKFIEFVETTKAEGHTNAEILGIVMTMRDKRSKYERDVVSGIKSVYGDLVFDAEIYRRTKIKEMAVEGIDLLHPSVKQYLSLVEEILERIGGK